MRFSIIIPAFNEEALIGDVLKSVLQLIGQYEVIVVDGHSQDRTYEIAKQLEAKHSDLRVVRDEQVRGRAQQMNYGAQMAGGDILLFLHVDCRLHPSSLHLIASRRSCLGSAW